MTNVIQFRRKKVVDTKPEKNFSMGSSIKMTNCHLEGNGIGMLLGDGVEVNMDNTRFVNNGTGIIAGSLDEQLLQMLKTATTTERFNYANELSNIVDEPDTKKRQELIKKSNLGQKLSTVANVATVGSWLGGIIGGVGSIDLNTVMQTIMGG
ncbi:hypothetical protein [Shewanella marina]|uniref:hypothetical protein n=1 Tax=Shewanella marina TaxID=487319 RepID=UPI00046F79FD|nr:hypothetical protein [Shewanella marina]